MELLYVWIEDYKNIKKQGFNFSPKHWFDFEYEEEDGEVTGGTLKHEDRNPNYPKDFFGDNISNVTAIVGRNGSGKSTLMEAILKFTLGNDLSIMKTDNPIIYNTPGGFKTIIIYKDEKEKLGYSCFSNLEIRIKHTDIKGKAFKFNVKTKKNYITNDDTSNFDNQFKKANFIPFYLNILPCYYSNIFDDAKIIENKNREDIVYIEKSETHINNPIRTDISINNRLAPYQNTVVFHYKEIENQAVFVNEFLETSQKLPFSLPPYLLAQLNYNENNLKDYINSKVVRMNWLKDQINNSNEFKIPNKVSDQIVLYLWLKGVTELEVKDSDKKEYKNDLLKNVDINPEINWTTEFLKFKKGLNNIKDSISTHSPYNFSILDYFDGIEELIHLKILRHYDHTIGNLSKRKSYKLQDKAELSKMIHFINCYQKISFSKIYQFGFSFNSNYVYNTLSSGEKTIMKFGSNMWNLVSTIKENYNDILPNILAKKDFKIPKNLLIMLDEAELTLHPEWQKTFLEWSLKIIKIACKDFKTVQVLYSSHSPFFLSDLPKGNVIFLKSKEGKDDSGNNINLCHVCAKEEQPEQTFGANIHSLYRNSFFLENGLMGEFAKGKIDQVIKDLNQDDAKNKIDEKRKEEIQFIIEQIGEPLIKRKLQQIYDETFHSPEQIDNRIKALEEEIKQLKGRQS